MPWNWYLALLRERTADDGRGGVETVHTVETSGEIRRN
jgi:hypothetical protein